MLSSWLKCFQSAFTPAHESCSYPVISWTYLEFETPAINWQNISGKSTINLAQYRPQGIRHSLRSVWSTTIKLYGQRSAAGRRKVKLWIMGKYLSGNWISFHFLGFLWASQVCVCDYMSMRERRKTKNVFIKINSAQICLNNNAGISDDEGR